VEACRHGVAATAHALALVRATGGVADRVGAVERNARALRVARASTAGQRRGHAADAALVRGAAVIAVRVAVARLAVALVADVAGAVTSVGSAVAVGAARAAGVLRRDAAELAGRAVIRRVVAVAGGAGVGEADRAAAVPVVVPAGGVGGAAAAAGVRRRDAAELAGGAVVRRVMAVAGQALRVGAGAQADVHRPVGRRVGDALCVAGAGEP